MVLKDIEQFFFRQPEPNQSCFLALRNLILAHDPAITETVKYSMPCFCYLKKALCYLWLDKKSQEPYILFVDGKALQHPMLESGDRAKMKILRIDPEKDLPKELISEILLEAISVRQIAK
ncbi:DUF1801 domain-containing protein [Algoriphagus machipongonensis]|uniref:YdhG-like domain-containing protein n=1 Tax=Algoriphagus machipongonensis TaxID=388413 RepID=A3HWB6_9BACT|nr:DUF1801 domain-containing protein [Algoriphagus machipongonensis]EAZ80889.1 hypothetical protein ALPR1_17673 [Algoriphagus machipongonensis]